MEYVEGNSILSVLQSKALGQQEAVRICTGILHGLNHLHMKRLLHRDLKPANVLLSGLVPKITDFGSMKRLSEGTIFTNASRHSDLYVPPEGWEDPSRYSFNSDIYQVGMVLYEMVNGCLAYDQGNYITTNLQKQLEAMNSSYECLDEVDKCIWSKRGIAELSRRGNLLQYGCSPRIYYSPKISRVIKFATNPDLEKRCSSVNQFLEKLIQVDVPDWKPVNDHYEAKGWKRFDWRVFDVPARGKTGPKVERAKTGTGKYRTIKALSLSSEREAFKFIEDFKG